MNNARWFIFKNLFPGELYGTVIEKDNPIRRQAKFYHLGDDRHYHLALPDAEGIYRSLSVAGFWLRVEWLWQDPLPSELDVLREVGIE